MLAVASLAGKAVSLAYAPPEAHRGPDFPDGAQALLPVSALIRMQLCGTLPGERQAGSIDQSRAICIRPPIGKTSMWLIDQLAEQHILQAIKRGEFDDLPGAGKPLNLDEDHLVPEHLRAGYRLLKNAGYLPPELQDLHEIREVETLLAHLMDPDEQERTVRRLRLLQLRLAESGRQGINLEMEGRYRHKLLASLGKDNQSDRCPRC
jgi:hypothetical protein